MDKSKSIYRAAGHYHWVLLTFIIVIIIIVIINNIWFVYLSIFIANKFILTTVNKNFSYFKSFKILLTCRISPPEVISRRGGVLWMCWGFPGAYLCMGVILTKLQSAFVELVLLCWCSFCGFTSCLRASFLENTSGGQFLNGDNFIYNFKFILFNKIYFWGFWHFCFFCHFD